MVYKRLLLLLIFSIYLSTSLFSQKILAFDKSGKVKRVKYYEHEFIRLKLLNGAKIQGEISIIKENSFVIDLKEVMLDSVAKVYNTQRYYGLNIVGKVMLIAGVGYFPLDTFNRLINNDDPLVSGNSAEISAMFLGIGLLCESIVNRGYKISEKRPLKIIDLTI